MLKALALLLKDEDYYQPYWSVYMRLKFNDFVTCTNDHII